MSLCKGYSSRECSVKVGCKVARGPKRTFCRKSKNSKRTTKKASPKRKSSPKRKTKRTFRRSETERLKGYNKKQSKALRQLM